MPLAETAKLRPTKYFVSQTISISTFTDWPGTGPFISVHEEKKDRPRGLKTPRTRVLGVFKRPGRSFSSGSLFNQPNAPEHSPEFLPSLLAKFRAPYQFANQQRIVT